MMIFRDRSDAGKKLAAALNSYSNDPEAVIISLPRGGVVVGYEVALILNLPMDIVCPRKIGAPFNPELAIGAITETGEGVLSDDLVASLGVSEEYILEIIEKESKEALWRLNHYRKDKSPRKLKGKKVIIVDDGLATGSTMRAAIKTVKAEHPQEIIMAVPVAPPDTLLKIENEVDHVVCLSAPVDFYAVGQFYEHFDQTTDEEVISLLSKVPADKP